MWRKEYHAYPVECTLTGKEDHLPVVTSLRIARKIGKPKKQAPRIIWNKQAFASKRRAERFRNQRDTALSEFINRSELKEPKNYYEMTIEQKAEEITNIIHTAGMEHIKKKRVFHKYHLTRLEKREIKLYADMKRLNTRFTSKIRNLDDSHFKSVSDIKEKIKRLQKQQKKERERYLERKIQSANKDKNIKKLNALLKSYQNGTSPSCENKISCVKDIDRRAKICTKGIIESFLETNI